MTEFSSAASYDGAIPPEQVISSMAMTYWRSQLIYAACRLGLADVIGRNGPSTPAAIAAKIDANASLVGRLLRALASLDIFVEDDQGRYSNTPLSETLRVDHPNSTRPIVLVSMDEKLWTAWIGLVDAIKTGDAPFQKVHGVSYYDYYAQDPERERTFAASMSGVSLLQNAAVASAYPFSEINTVVDVGGGNGHLLAEILRRHPHVTGTVFDLPGVIDSCRAAGHIDAPDVKERISTQGGDVFVGPPAGADAYILKSVVHNWNDDDTVRILDRCRVAMAHGGRVLIAEALLKGANEPDWYKLVDLAMFVVFGAEERTAAQFRGLLERAGLRLSRIFPTESGLSVIEAVAA